MVVNVTDLRIWRWIILSSHGLYEGEVVGELDEGETEEAAMENVSRVVASLAVSQSISPVLAIIVTSGEIFVNAPGSVKTELNIKQTFKK